MTTPSQQPAKRARVDDGPEGVHSVERAKTGGGHCGWCDTQIQQGSPRVVKHQYHAPGGFVRNNGAARGVNPGGMMDLYLHPQCAWTHQKVSRREQACSGCRVALKPDTWHFFTRLGIESDRCVESSSGKVWQCADCVRRLVQSHQTLLAGHIGEQSQFDEPVAWVTGRTLFGGPVVRPGPADQSVKKLLRQVFRSDVANEANEANEAKAVERHRALQNIIRAATKADAARGGKPSHSLTSRKECLRG